MPEYFFIQTDDLKPDLSITVTDEDGNQVTFVEGTTAKFSMYDPVTGTTYTSAANAVISQTSTVTTFTQGWDAPMTVAPGTYYGRFLVTYPSGATLHIPNDDYIIVRVTE